jgi:Tfp pilus assembly protein PilP
MKAIQGRGPEVAAKVAPPPVDPVKAQLLAEVRKRGFRNEDFIESDANRDPFRCYLQDFAGGQAITTQYKILLPKYSLEELKLIAIVGPPTVDSRGRTIRLAHGRSAQERAMFLDPAQTGVSVVRGEHLSKADAKVTRIDSEKGKVYVELKEDLGAGKTRTVERVLELHQGESPEAGNQ